MLQLSDFAAHLSPRLLTSNADPADLVVLALMCGAFIGIIIGALLHVVESSSVRTRLKAQALMLAVAVPLLWAWAGLLALASLATVLVLFNLMLAYLQGDFAARAQALTACSRTQ